MVKLSILKFNPIFLNWIVNLKFSLLHRYVPIANVPSEVSFPLKINLKESPGFFTKKSLKTKVACDALYTPSFPRIFNKIFSFPNVTNSDALFEVIAFSMAEYGISVVVVLRNTKNEVNIE